MTVELDRLRSLASVIEAAEDELAVARQTLRETAVALLRCGDATLAEVKGATGLEQGELLELLDALPPLHLLGPRRPGIWSLGPV